MAVTLTLSDEQLFQLLNELPPPKVQEVLAFLQQKSKTPSNATGAKEAPKVYREPGGLKGALTYMADDFDAP